MIWATLVCIAACGVLVNAEWRRQARVRIAAKAVASFAFLAVALLARRPLDSYTNWMLAGLALGVIGDLALLGDSSRAFLVGLGAFLLGHLAYVVGMAQLVSPVDWIPRAGLGALLPVAVAALALIRLWPKLGEMRVPVIGYVVAIVAMVIAAFAVLRTDTALAYEESNRLALGAILFFASDLSVARDKFLAQTFANRAWGLPAYYAGQLLIAWSLT